ncbi:GNAT family N-acetyltransferase [Candidatus Woesebacteria bacterium]|nr:GNAT family N-acetyltransferase [Candidatus Woesebacteria bacterium]
MITFNHEVWATLDHKKMLLLSNLKSHEVVTAKHAFVLIPSKPGTFDLSYYQDTFSDPNTTKYLTISSDFSAEEYISRMNGDFFTPLGGSPNNLLYHIFPLASDIKSKGPIGHVSIKDINWDRMSFHRGLVIRPGYQGNGIGSQVGIAVLNRMRALGFRTALTEVKEGNENSLKLVRKQFGEGILHDGKYLFELDLTQATLS